MHKSNFSGRVSKWAVELGQYDIRYQPRTAIKAQVLTDFLVEFTFLSPAPTTVDTGLGDNTGESGTLKTDEGRSEDEFAARAWKVFVDGSSTCKRADAGIVLQSPEGLVIE